MNRFKIRLLGLFLCLTIAFGMLPVQAETLSDNFVTREQAVVSILSTIGYGTLNETENNLSTFSDAASVTNQYRDEIGVAVTNGILVGSGATLDPHRNVTRLEFAMFLSRSIRELPDLIDSQTFYDVPASAAGDVNRLVKAGLFSGYGNGLFGSNDFLTREQLNTVMERVRNLKNTDLKDDYYYSINYEWLNNTKLPAGYPGFGSFDEVSLSNDAKLKEIAHEIYENKDTYKRGSIEQKLADFYSSVLDMENRNKQGIEPIKKYLDRFDQVKTAQELLDYAAEFENETGYNPLFTFSPSGDLLDSNKYSLYGQGLSTGLNSAYLLSGDPQIKALYEGFIAQMLMASGINQEDAVVQAQKVYEFEVLLAENTLSNEQASKVENLYNPVTKNDLVKAFPKVDLNKYLSDLGYESVENLVITDVKLMTKTGELICNENIDVLKSYVRTKLVTNTSNLLSKDLQDAILEFNAVFLGLSSTMSDEDIAFNLLNSVMSGYLGRVYVEKYFSPEAKADVEEMVHEIIETYKKRIQRLEWMGENTKAAAIKKLDTMTIKIGYPEKWEDPYENIELKSYDDGGSLLGNIFAITSAQVKHSKTLLEKPVDKSGWFMSPQTVNAYYNALNNEIVFPAGILQPPFYDVNASREQNLGGIGAVIAHEITHAFDHNGAQFDEKGNMNNWWTPEDYQTFQQKTKSVVELYDGLEIAPDILVNGNLTLSENVSDIGGVACVLEIMKEIPDADYKAFFESNGRIWRYTATPKMYQLLAQQDTHSPHKFRSNMVIRNFQEFYDTYNIQPVDRMYLAPEKRVNVW
ncbi:MAG: peptidase [Clostridiaceae bacterium]|nr:peptidase [Clostridiaceae bacterium]